MDPLSAAASVLSVISTIASVTSAVTAFMRDVRGARKEMVAVRRDLAGLKSVLEILGEDLGDSTDNGFPESLQTQVVEIARNCNQVVEDIGAYVRSSNRSRIRWAASDKVDVEKLRRDLEVHKMTLSVTLDCCRCDHVLKDVKNDTGQILQDTATLKLDTAQIQDNLDRILVEISQLRTAEPSKGQSGVMLERYLENLRSDAATVLDDADYLEETSSHSNSLDGRWRDIAAQTATVTAHFRFAGDEMDKLIRQSYAHLPEDEKRDINERKYDLVSPDGEIILPDLWAGLVKPG
ncbi:hypothetical protein B0T22DRAFT_479921 [Podospora appendiculata]|uniref:Fungal N-terminal domain-containing protein n=1 Tax=Podospora appendiculata TaxID=314037 RepID=A0AAE0X9S5_9PEZI|nr:hypothetical protein B0T22DRAFT_479921 [Podospora appendiculata]